MQETTLTDDNGTVLLRFASAYGFRNIQSLVRQIRSGRCAYDYVEVMACPGGCLNGGGQLRTRAGEPVADWLARLDAIYHQRVRWHLFPGSRRVCVYMCTLAEAPTPHGHAGQQLEWLVCTCLTVWYALYLLSRS
jgi:hypothetical protein